MKRKAIKGQCRWCDKAILDGKGNVAKVTWHPWCVDQYKLIHWPAETRRQVLARDNGVCSCCGRNAEHEKRRFIRASNGAHYGLRPLLSCWREGASLTIEQHNRLEARYLKNAKLHEAVKRRYYDMRDAGWTMNDSGWQADHIRPLCEAHGDISYWQLDNLRTLCTPCHKRKTSEDVARLAANRRASKRLAVQLSMAA